MPEPMKVGLVALAAGSSRRFGSANKLLHEVDGEPLVQRVVSRLCDGAAAAGVDAELVVVLGCDEASVRGALSGFAALWAPNPQYQLGMGTSVACGVRALSQDVEAIVVAPCDLPNLSADSIRRLIEALKNRAEIAQFRSGERLSSPTGFSARYRDELQDLQGDTGAKWIVQRDRAHVHFIDVDDHELVDVDQPSDAP